MRRAIVRAAPAASRVTQGTEFDAELDLGTVPAAQSLADQHFIVAGAIEVAGVDQRHVGVSKA